MQRRLFSHDPRNSGSELSSSNGNDGCSSSGATPSATAGTKPHRIITASVRPSCGRMAGTYCGKETLKLEENFHQRSAGSNSRSAASCAGRTYRSHMMCHHNLRQYANALSQWCDASPPYVASPGDANNRKLGGGGSAALQPQSFFEAIRAPSVSDCIFAQQMTGCTAPKPAK